MGQSTIMNGFMHNTMIDGFMLNETPFFVKEPNEQSAMKVKKEKKIQLIKGIEQVIESEKLDIYGDCRISSLTVTEDERIASGGVDGNISISSYNVNEKEWNIDIYEWRAHIGNVYSLCALDGNKLLSSGGYDNSIKVWSLSDVELTFIKIIKEHTDIVPKVIPLSNERFASCSWDKTIRIWEDYTYQCLSILQHDDCINSILHLRGKEVLVSAYDGFESSSRGVSFWNINNYTNQHTIQGYSAFGSTGMAELPNGNIALSSTVKPYPIVIIDTSTYQIVTVIQLQWQIIRCSSLCIFDEHSFIYVNEGTFLQISSEDGSVLFHLKGGNFKGYFGILPLEGGKYFAINYGPSISIIKPCYGYGSYCGGLDN